MRAGRLDRRITIQRKSEIQSASGQPVITWATLPTAQRLWASMTPASGDERFTDPQVAAKQQVEFKIRWSLFVADLSPLDRIVYPAINSGDTPAPTAIYDILAVHELERREGLSIIAFRRADT